MDAQKVLRERPDFRTRVVREQAIRAPITKRVDQKDSSRKEKRDE